MAFDVSYIFRAKDRYSEIAKKVVRANEGVKRTAAEAGRAVKSRFNPALDSAKNKARSAKAQVSQLTQSIAQGFVPAMRKARNVGLGLTAGVTLPFLLTANAAAEAASDAEETNAKFGTIFRDIRGNANEMASQFAKDFGLAGSSAKKLLGDTGDLLTGFGFTQERALDLSREVNSLAVDLASFTNFAGGAEGASSALTKALFGEREALKSLGVVITEDLVKKRIATMLSEGRKFASLAEAKAVATLAIATEQSKNAIGDFARTQNSAANITRRRNEQLKELRETFGKLLLPIQNKINLSIIKMSKFLNELSPGVKQAILVVGGLAAALGPVLVVVGSIGLALPVMAKGLALVKAGMVGLLGPVGIILAVGTALAFLIAKSQKVRDFFKGVGLGIEESIGPTLRTVIADMREAAGVIANLFGSGSEAGQAIGETEQGFNSVMEAGRAMGSVVGGVIDAVVTGLRAIGKLLGQIAGAIANLDFGNFDLSGITDDLKGMNERLGLTGFTEDVTDFLFSAREGVRGLAGDMGLLDKDVTRKINVVTRQAKVGARAVTAPNPAVKTTDSVTAANSRATIDGQIVVSATEGAKVESAESKAVFKGAQGNIGLGVAG